MQEPDLMSYSRDDQAIWQYFHDLTIEHEAAKKRNAEWQEDFEARLLALKIRLFPIHEVQK